MRMFLGGLDSADSTQSIFNTEGNGQGQGKGSGSQNLGGISDKVYASVDNERGLFVLHPDLLISPTKIAEAIGCVRRGVISERVKSLGGFNKAAVLGNLRHSFIEVRGLLTVLLVLLLLLVGLGLVLYLMRLMLLVLYLLLSGSLWIGFEHCSVSSRQMLAYVIAIISKV